MQHDILLSPIRLSDLEKIIEASVQRAVSCTKSPVEELGGIELATEMTRLSRARVYALVASRGIPHFKRGNRLTFRKSDLAAWLLEGRRDQKGDPS